MSNNQDVYQLLNKRAELEKSRHIASLLRLMADARLLREEGKITVAEYNKIARDSGYHRLSEEAKKTYADSVIYYHYRLRDLYHRILTVYRQYKTGLTYKDHYPSLQKELEEFLKYINYYKLYQELQANNLIYQSKKPAARTVCINAGRLSHIVIRNPKDDKLKPTEVTMAHEMGHAAYYYVTAKTIKTPFARGIESEIMSFTFERMFLEFLRETGKLEQSLFNAIVKNYETNKVCTLRDALKVIDILDDPDATYVIKGTDITYTDPSGVHVEDLFAQPYAVGNLAASMLFNEYQSDREYFIKHLPSLMKDINQKDFGGILDEYSDVFALKKCLDRNLVRK